MNFYEILGVPQHAGEGEIKAAYRRLAHRHHPDKNQGREDEAKQVFLMVQLAYECLSDPEKREAYDYQLALRTRDKATGHAPIVRSQEDQAKDAALARAVARGNLRLAETLLTQGAFARSKDGNGSPLVHLAVAQGRFDLAMLLLVWGADPNAKDQDGRTALHAAMGTPDYTSLADLLLANGALPTIVDATGQTPLHQAARAGGPEALELMLEYGADLLGRDELGRTALHHAVLSRSHAAVQVLVSRRANLNVRDKQGLSPLGLARSLGLDDLSLHLASLGARE